MRSDGELHATHRPGNRSPCIRTPLLHADVYAPSEGHVCYTLRRGCSYGEAVYTTPGDVKSSLLIVQRFSNLMHSVCILIYVSMYSYGYLLCTHGISGLAARSDCQQFEVCLTMTTNMYSPSLSPPPLPVYLRTPAVALQRFTLGP